MACTHEANTNVSRPTPLISSPSDGIATEADCCPKDTCLRLIGEDGATTGDTISAVQITTEDSEGSFAGFIYKDGSGSELIVGESAGEYKVVDCGC